MESYSISLRHCVASIALGLSAASMHAQTPSVSSLNERMDALQAEITQLHQENESLRKQIGMAESSATSRAATNATGIRLNGEMRLRYEAFRSENDAMVNRDRPRLRLRLGSAVELPRNVEVGMRLTTGVVDGEPTGNNQTWQDNASKKPIAIDLAYVKWSPVKNEVASLALTGGKMNIPLTTSDLVFDTDYTPEGVAVQYSRVVAPGHVVKVNAAQLVIDEISNSSHDPMFYGGQVRYDGALSGSWGTSLGFTAVGVSNADRLTNTAVPDIHRGNTRSASGVLVNSYRPYIADAALVRTFDSVPGYPGVFAVKFFGDYMWNPATSSNNRGYIGGIAFGKAGKAGSWEFGYRYRVIQSDAWYEELADSDSGGFYQSAPTGGTAGYGGGTNVRGHIFSGNYAVTDYALVGFTYFATRLINPSPMGSASGMGRLQVNTILKF